MTSIIEPAERIVASLKMSSLSATFAAKFFEAHNIHVFAVPFLNTVMFFSEEDLIAVKLRWSDVELDKAILEHIYHDTPW